ncbi:MAG: M14 family metallopeptidase [Planctomycetota bacterium]
MRALLVVVLAAVLPGQDPLFAPGTRYEPSVPDLRAVLGHGFGGKISSHAETERYAKALAAASPRVKLVPYGETWEGRSLYYLVVGSAANVARAAEVQSGMAELADPRELSDARAKTLTDALPAVAWLAYAVHGNEISGTDAALACAYHLAAASGDEVVDLVRRECLVVIDPLQNPDGRDRFVHSFRQTRGRWADADPFAAERDEPWPGGRTNHYLFDMNRDWIALSQPETRGRVRAFLQWFPLVYVDLHEMGTNSTYYFPPPAEPINPEFTSAQRRWLETFGRNNARWFDRMGFDYFSREVFDAFYPGYGEGWPMFHGTIGMTYEQASVRGLVVEREDETTMHYRDSVRRHFVASLATLETAARERGALLRSFVDYRRSAVQEGLDGEVKAYLLPPGDDPDRTAELVRLLMAQGVEVQRAASELPLGDVRDPDTGAVGDALLPAGTFVVSPAQPAKHLVEALLARRVDMAPDFVAEQERRRQKRLGTEIYDVTAWSLPLLFDVAVREALQPVTAELVELTQPPSAPHAPPGAIAKVGYLLPWGSHAVAQALAALLMEDVRVHVADAEFGLGGRTYPRGTLFVKRRDNPADLHQLLTVVSAQTGAEIVPIDSAWTDHGIGLGSNKVRFVERARIALAWDRPVSSYSAGWARYVLEQWLGYPVTAVRTARFGRADLDRYNVIVLPEGAYDAESLPVSRLRAWIRAGGTLVTLGRATRWLTLDDVGLLASQAERRPSPGKDGDASGPKSDAPPAEAESAGDAEAGDTEQPSAPEPFDLEAAIQPEDEAPDRLPGAIVRIALDAEHWLSFGYAGGANVLANTANIFTPVKLDKGRNVGVYEVEDRLVLSGLAWADTRQQMAQKAYLVHQPLGRGHVIAFAEDPNFRTLSRGLGVLFANAVFFGPAH